MRRTDHKTEHRPDPGPERTITWTRKTIEALQRDPAISLWLKVTIRDLSRRDPVDALAEADLLCALMQAHP